jgi:NADH:ubiquinone oxidoreductase subunit F (NADH-binding)
MSEESCGRCAPCALGSRAALARASRDLDARARAELRTLFDTMEQASLCAFGQLLPGPKRALLARCGGPESAAETDS